MTDIEYMQVALLEAEKAAAAGEVPVGAIAVIDDEIVAKSFNLMEQKKSALAHAEILIIQELNRIVGDWRLDMATIYVTKEPCPMCAGAMVNSHIKKVVFGMADNRSGACGSSPHNIADNPDMLWQIEVVPRILEDECTMLFKQFFKKIREEKQKQKKDNL
ncbi:MAG: nucleoside deaminase [Lentisphaeria bacterium]|nr:nucleoside deaminase [Lentisphaeria bacterium]MBR7128047.1 nucleoside deaminase [Lentisphaeria bacterium]